VNGGSAGHLTRPESTSSGPPAEAVAGSGPLALPLATLGGAPAGDSVTPFALVAERAVAGSALASAFCLAAFGFDLAALAFGLPAFSALAAFFAALPLPALAVSDLAAPADEFALRLAEAEPGVLLAAVRAAPDPAAVDRAAPFRAVVAEVFAVVALDAVEPLARAAEALLAVRTAVVLAAGLVAARRGAALAAVTLVAVVLVGVVLAPEVLDAVVLAGAAARALAASLSDVTAVSSALVADEIAVSALVSVLADVAA
jgi:hypothetical protein